MTGPEPTTRPTRPTQPPRLTSVGRQRRAPLLWGGCASATTIATLAANASVSCAITLDLPATAPSDIAGMSASQPLTWQLAKS